MEIPVISCVFWKPIHQTCFLRRWLKKEGENHNLVVSLLFFFCVLYGSCREQDLRLSLVFLLCIYFAFLHPKEQPSTLRTSKTRSYGNNDSCYLLSTHYPLGSGFYTRLHSSNWGGVLTHTLYWNRHRSRIKNRGAKINQSRVWWDELYPLLTVCPWPSGIPPWPSSHKRDHTVPPSQGSGRMKSWGPQRVSPASGSHDALNKW